MWYSYLHGQGNPKSNHKISSKRAEFSGSSEAVPSGDNEWAAVPVWFNAKTRIISAKKSSNALDIEPIVVKEN